MGDYEESAAMAAVIAVARRVVLLRERGGAFYGESEFRVSELAEAIRTLDRLREERK
jgi:hypothetical protein